MKSFFNYMIRSAFILVLFAFVNQVHAQEFNKENKTKIVDKISSLLEEKYVFPDVGKKCGKHIKSKLTSGAFDNITDKKEFADILTKELQSISKDKHMRVRLDNRPQEQQSNSEDPFYQEFIFAGETREDNLGFAKVEFLEGGIGYLDLRFFAPLEFTKKYAEAAMQLLSNSDALIIDLRKNKGGNPDLIQFIQSYFFAEPTHLNSLYWREGNRTQEFWTKKIENSTLIDVPIYVLTSNRTFSGGEEFTNNLKTRKRATIIGETTGGGANPGGMFAVDEGFGIFIPTGRAINPVTNSNWEGTGVEPDIKVESDKALDIALEKAKISAEEYRTNKNKEMKKVLESINKKLSEGEKLFSTDKNKAEELVTQALDEGLRNKLANENSINMAGYNYLQKNKIDMAIAIFKYNVKKFPDSANTYDSLGEAYMKNNQKDLAIQNYKKSLELNPENKNAEDMIKKMSN
ncbi:MAG TPA: S41 family peptidase [Ignavibacteriaceae bacterium]|nr:S41 family peptidase [Ignavibacteriaceae bacterium]